jgi:hypothetical protein
MRLRYGVRLQTRKTQRHRRMPHSLAPLGPFRDTVLNAIERSRFLQDCPALLASAPLFVTGNSRLSILPLGATQSLLTQPSCRCAFSRSPPSTIRVSPSTSLSRASQTVYACSAHPRPQMLVIVASFQLARTGVLIIRRPTPTFG